MSAQWVTAATALALAVVGCLAAITRWGWRIARRVSHFLDDYSGQPARDGLPERPGVMARLQSVEELVAKVVAETTPNGGKSLRDAVNRTAADVADIRIEQARVRADLAGLQRREGR
jgi:hypothetical protein